MSATLRQICRASSRWDSSAGGSGGGAGTAAAACPCAAATGAQPTTGGGANTGSDWRKKDVTAPAAATGCVCLRAAGAAVPSCTTVDGAEKVPAAVGVRLLWLGESGWWCWAQGSADAAAFAAA